MWTVNRYEGVVAEIHAVRPFHWAVYQPGFKLRGVWEAYNRTVRPRSLTPRIALTR